MFQSLDGKKKGKHVIQIIVFKGRFSEKSKVLLKKPR